MRSPRSRSTLFSALAVAAFVVFVIVQNRGPVAFSTTSVATFLIVGLALGGIYAITALGLVVTYTTTGIFNFAHGAIGAFLAFLYWELRINRGWPTALALVVVVLVVAPALGVLLDRLLMRRLRDADLVVQLMVTVGLMLAFMGITLTVWKPNVGRSLPQFFQDAAGIEVSGITITWHRLTTVAVALAIALVLRLLLYRTRTGIAMRAVVDDPALAGLNGANPTRVSSAAWALGSMTAAVSGILIASETGMVVENLTLVIVIAFAAAAIARLRSLPWAFAGGLLIGLARAFSAQFLSFGEDFSFAPDAIPAAILLVALLFLPEAGLERSRPRVTTRTERLTSPAEAAAGAVAIVGLVVAWANGWIPWFTGTTFGERTSVWLGRGVGFLVLGLVMLSLVPLIGWAGQVCFANFAIAGFGAAMFAHVGGQDGDAMGLVWVALICAPLGVLAALPALRLRGLYLALATMAFAEFADKILFRHPDVISRTNNGVLYEPLHVLGFRISSDAADRKAFVVFLAVSFGVLFFLVSMLRRSRWARRWIAMADSPVASATMGMSLPVAKLSVFALSGAMAGFAGALLGLSKGALAVDSFPLFAGLPLVLLLAVQGVRYPVAAFVGMLGLASFPASFELLGRPGWMSSIELIGPGLAAITMAFRPEGGVFYAGRDLGGVLPWRGDLREEKRRSRARARAADITRGEIGDLGLTRPLTPAHAAQLERALGVDVDRGRSIV